MADHTDVSVADLDRLIREMAQDMERGVEDAEGEMPDTIEADESDEDEARLRFRVREIRSLQDILDFLEVMRIRYRFHEGMTIWGEPTVSRLRSLGVVEELPDPTPDDDEYYDEGEFYDHSTGFLTTIAPVALDATLTVNTTENRPIAVVDDAGNTTVHDADALQESPNLPSFRQIFGLNPAPEETAGE